MVERSKAGAAKITVKDFDDLEARAMHDVDRDLSDSARALIRNHINIADRTAPQGQDAPEAPAGPWGRPESLAGRAPSLRREPTDYRAVDGLA